MDAMTDTATAPQQSPEDALAYFHSRRELAVVQPLGSLALVNTQVIDSEQPIWGVPGRWAPLPSGESGLKVIASAADGIRVDGEVVDGEAVVRGKDDPSPSEVVFSDTLRGFVIRLESGQYALRVFDAESEGIRDFGRIDAYPYDPDWVVTAAWSENPEGTTVGFEHTSDGKTREEAVPGSIRFTHDGVD